ncbi:MAG TPA: PIN domain-containing protein, partial [Methylocystis sp.]|nr:PIN domain-containing protein [Methylocystis sp.]
MLPTIYLDANVFIYFVEGDAAIAEDLHGLFELLEQRRSLAVTGELTLAEVLAPPRQATAWSLARKRTLYLDLILGGDFVELEPISREILIQSANLREHSTLKLADAVHIASAVPRRCDFFM